VSFHRKNPLFAFAMLVCAVVALGELALIHERFTASRAAARRLEQRKGELATTATLIPAPTREIAAAIQADLTRAQASLASMQAELKGRGPSAERIHNAKVPAARTDAYFDLATFVEKMRELARKNDVDLRPEAARFGFAAYANEGPLPDHIEPVFRQRQVAQYLVEALLEARPRALLAVKRERTVTKAEREERAAALANGGTPPEPTSEPAEEGPDIFAIDKRITARAPGYIDTLPFRFVFTGQTAALRTFLNKLASFELPVLVREVEVDTATAEETAASTPAEGEAVANETAAAPASASPPPSVVLSLDPPAAKAPAARVAPRTTRAPVAAPIVTKPLSKFTVTVEFVELVPPPAPPPAEAAPSPPPS
jgi:hypothetical protein